MRPSAHASAQLLETFDTGVAVVLSSAGAIKESGATMKELTEHVIEIPV